MASSTDESQIVSAVAPLVAAGFAIHWLRPRSKAPSGAGWSTAPVATIEDLRQTNRPGANVGARFGEPSRTDAGYLHLFDVDIRVAEYADEAWAALAALLPGIDIASLPSVISGSGGASRHVYFVTDKPFSGKLLAVSEGKHRRSKVEVATGDRKEGWSYDWEIELYGTGKQAVLPPSIHPETGKPYVWEREFDLDLLAFGVGPSIPVKMIEALGVTNRTTYEFETQEPLDFKPGQLEQELSEIEVSDLAYDDWIRLGQALHHQFGGAEQGWNLWLQHTRRSTKYNGDDRYARKKWQSFGRYRGRPVTMKTIRHWVQEARVKALSDELGDLFDEDDDDGDEDDELTIEGLLGEPLSLPTSVLDLEFDSPPPTTIAPGAQGVTIPDPIEPEWESRLDLNDKGVIISNLHNIRLIVTNDPRTWGVFALNQFTKEQVLKKDAGRLVPRKAGPKGTVQLVDGTLWQLTDERNGNMLEDAHEYSLRAMLEAPRRQGGYGLKASDRDVRAAVALAARRYAFHPVREYLDSLVWDGVNRVERLFVDYLGAEDNAYHREIATKTLLGAVTRVFEPGHKFDFVPILEGVQGKRKSTFIETLGKHWSCELEGDFHDRKAMVEKMQGAWIMELPELQGFVRAEITTLKGFVSARKDKARLAWERRAAEFPRQCIFFGSTNNPEYLRDETGNRRFWPIYCGIDGEIDIKRLGENMDQIWAEARAMYTEARRRQPKGFLPLYIESDEAQVIAKGLQESRKIETAEDGLAGLIEALLDEPIAAEFDDLDGKLVYRQLICLQQIWCDLLGRDLANYNQPQAQQLGRAMGLVKSWKRSTKRRFKGYGTQTSYVRVSQPEKE